MKKFIHQESSHVIKYQDIHDSSWLTDLIFSLNDCKKINHSLDLTIAIGKFISDKRY